MLLNKAARFPDLKSQEELDQKQTKNYEPAHMMQALLLFGWWTLPILLIPVIKNLWTKWRSK